MINTKMKKANIIIILFNVFFYSVNGQNLSNKENIKKNSISIEYYKPIENSIRDFIWGGNVLSYPDWQRTDYSSNSESISLGVCYERVFRNNIIFRPRLGFSLIEVNEQNKSGIYTTGNNAIGNDTQNYHFNEKYINLFIGLAKRIELSKKINVDFGIDLASIFLVDGNRNLEENYITTNFLTQGNVYKHNVNRQAEIGNSNSFGLGPYIKPEIVFCNNFFISAEFQIYFLKTISDGKSTQSDITTDTFTNSSETNTVILKINREINNDIKQWNWSELSPLIRIGYKF